jgi:ornithine cyclodeaminase
MPAHREGSAAVYSLKELVVVPDNPARRGLDAHQGAVILHDGETGMLLAIMNASPVTEIRTAAVSAIATRTFALPGAKRVAILGAGVQARAHVQAMRTVLEDAEIRIWARRPEAADEFARDVGGTTFPSIEAALRDAEVVCAATSATKALVQRSWLAEGTHVNAVGAFGPGRELDTETVASASLFVDRRESAINEGGDYGEAAAEGAIGPDHIKAELGEVLAGMRRGRETGDELTVFKSYGIGVEDLAAAELVVQKAREGGVGVEVKF